MMDYYDHDERERKQMYHSSGIIYRAGLDESEDGGCNGGRSGKGSGGGSDGGSGGGSGGDSGGDGGGDGCADGGGINGAAEITEIDINYY